MKRSNDGFEIAEYDLRLRGPGELFSTRQHGLPDLKFASLLHDYDLLVKAREWAKEYIGKSVKVIFGKSNVIGHKIEMDVFNSEILKIPLICYMKKLRKLIQRTKQKNLPKGQLSLVKNIILNF